MGSVTTEPGTKEKVPANYLPGAPTVHYSPGFNEVMEAECQYEEQVAPTALDLPTTGLYSPRDSSKGATLTKVVTDETQDLIARRSKSQSGTPLSANGAVKVEIPSVLS